MDNQERGEKGSRNHLFNAFSLSLGTIALVKGVIEKDKQTMLVCTYDPSTLRLRHCGL